MKINFVSAGRPGSASESKLAAVPAVGVPAVGTPAVGVAAATGVASSTAMRLPRREPRDQRAHSGSHKTS
jgi:hypothetical protein